MTEKPPIVRPVALSAACSGVCSSSAVVRVIQPLGWIVSKPPTSPRSGRGVAHVGGVEAVKTREEANGTREKYLHRIAAPLPAGAD